MSEAPVKPSHVAVNNDGFVLRLVGRDSVGRIDIALTPQAALGLAQDLIAEAARNLQHKKD